jgi:hypothetical protein
VLRGLLVLAGLGLTLYALIDCIRTDDSEVRGVPKVVWVLLILLVTVVGPIAWIVAGRNRSSPGPVQRPPGPVAPDDDPEFLRRIEQQRRLQAEDERLRRWEEELRQRDQDQGDGDGAGAGR